GASPERRTDLTGQLLAPRCRLSQPLRHCRASPMRFPFGLILCLATLVGTFGPQTAAQQNSAALPTHPLTNQDVVRMVKAGFGDSTIVKMIDSHGAAFDLSVDGL